MARSRRTRRGSSIDIWPGFVDALTQLTMVIVFLLLVFTVGQFYLSGAVHDKDDALKRLTEQLNSLSAMLALEPTSGDLAARLTAIRGRIDALTKARADGEAEVARLKDGNADKEKTLTSQTEIIALLNQNIAALKEELAKLSAALDLSTETGKNQQSEIAELGAKLNRALADRVEELAGFRSEFFGRLRSILGDRPDIRIVGDRFVFQSEVLFEPGSADLSEAARQQLQPLVAALKEIQGRIPNTIAWILEIDGHTDRRPINSPQFKSNWELSTGRAVSVVKYLIDQGIPADHVAAAGFGEFQPIDRGMGEEALRRNRRIELKLTQR